MPRNRSAISCSVGSFGPGLVPRAARDLVQVLRERLGETVGERLDHDRVVVVVLGGEAGGELVGAEAGGDRERAQEVVRPARRSPRGSGSGASRRSRSAGGGSRSAFPRRRRRRHPRRPPARSRTRLVACNNRSLDDPVEQALGVVPELARRRLRRGSPGTSPSAPRRGRRTASRCSRAASRDRPPLAPPGELRHGQVVEGDAMAVLARALKRQQRLALLLGVEVAQPLLVDAVLAVEALAPLGIEQRLRRRRRRARRRGRGRPAASTRARSAPPCAGARSSRRRSGAAGRARAAPSRARRRPSGRATA